MPLSKKGGITKQMRRKMAANLPLNRPPTHAGLPPSLYVSLQSISDLEEYIQKITSANREALVKMKNKADRIQGAFDAATETISKFQTNSRPYTDMLLVLDVISQNLAEVGQQISRLESSLASETASITLAFNMQQNEITSHREVFGRLDIDEVQPQQPSRRGLTLRSVNVPSPARGSRTVTRPPSPARAPQALASPPKTPPRLVQEPISQFMIRSPSTLDTTMMVTPEQVVFQRCPHMRLHRLLLSADRNAKKMLRQSCKKRCGPSSDNRFTLWPPLAQRIHELPASPEKTTTPPKNLNPNQGVQSATEANDVFASSSSEESVRPASPSTVELRSSPSTILVSSSPIVPASPTPPPPSPSSSIIEQIDGATYVEEPSEDGSLSLSLVCPLPWSERVCYREFPDEPRQPRACDSYFGRRTPCKEECSFYAETGACGHNIEDADGVIRSNSGFQVNFPMPMSGTLDPQEPATFLEQRIYGTPGQQ